MFEIRQDIPMIFCTGYNENIDEGKARSIGIRAFLIKPVRKKEFFNSIRSVLDKV